MPRTLISLGANLGNVRESMQAAKRLLSDTFGATNIALSQLYRTPPIGGPDGQGDFLNAVAAIETDRSVWEVWEIIKGIESNLGRQRQLRWEARRIDIDLLLYDQHRIWTPHLKIPHPRMCMRTFVIIPACEIVPNWIEPVTLWSISRMQDHLRLTTLNRVPIRVLCQDHTHLSSLRNEFESTEGNEQIDVVWETANPTQLSSNAPYKLTIAAVASPDPTTILWEDCSKPWVQAFNMESTSTTDSSRAACVQGPRYLMPSDDTKWAVHEIFAADQAMRCALELAGQF